MPQPDWVHYTAAITLVVLSVGSWIGSFFRFPGNWVVVVMAGLSAHFVPIRTGVPGIAWMTVGVLGGIALVGELVEYFLGRSSGQAGGVHRRSLTIALVGGISGALIASALPLPIPLIGASLSPILGAIGGAWGGAYVGEVFYSERPGWSRLKIQTSLVTRLLGTVGKLVAGLTMLAILTSALFRS